MTDLDCPPADPVEWEISHLLTCDLQPAFGAAVMTVRQVMVVTAQTAFEAHRKACVLLTSSPPFGSCVVERVGGGR